MIATCLTGLSGSGASGRGEQPESQAEDLAKLFRTVLGARARFADIVIFFVVNLSSAVVDVLNCIAF